ncbi:MAG: hypothetical protein U9Q85_04820 [Patescibacteria group bacterium]|nr:hypothetical protein [Patescibacteria group bacterium]
MSEENNSIQEQKTKEPSKKPINDNRLCAILAYLLLGIVWYFADNKIKKNEFAKFHVKQAIVLIIVSLVGSIGLGITILAWLIPLYQIAIFVLVMIGIYNAYSGKKEELPVIGKFSDKINI